MPKKPKNQRAKSIVSEPERTTGVRGRTSESDQGAPKGAPREDERGGRRNTVVQPGAAQWTSLSDSGSPTPKTPADSTVVMTELVLPQHTNALGSIFGGTVMSWIDIAGAISAGKHARSTVVTASIDALHFIAPIRLGHVVELKASVNATGRTSMEVGVRVESENPLTGEKFHNVSAYLTFVALGSDGKAREIPPLEPQTPAEKRRHQAAQRRRASRVALAAELKREELGRK